MLGVLGECEGLLAKSYDEVTESLEGQEISPCLVKEGQSGNLKDYLSF
jgi:hypothetical protein